MKRFLCRRSVTVRAACAVAVVLLSSCGGGLVLDSRWREQPIVIDGIDDEWAGRVREFKEARVVIGIMNDDEFLYVIMGTTSWSAQFHVMRGLNIWFDPEGGEAKTFGIRYPVIEEELMIAARRRVEEHSPQEMPDAKKMAARFKELSEAMTDLEVFGAEGSIGRMPIDEAGGIEAKLGRKEDTLIFEAKIPLAKRSRHLYSIGTVAGDRIGIGLESPEFRIPDAFAYDRPGQVGGPGASHNPRQGRETIPPPPGDYPERPRQISVWARLQLATAPTPR